MSYRHVAELCLKILALYWVLVTINNLSTNSIVYITILGDKTPLTKFMLSSTFATLLIPVIIFLFLLFFAKPLSKYIAPSDIDQNTEILNIKSTDLHYVLLSIFGFIIITLSIIPLVRIFLTIVTEINRTSDDLFGAKAFLLGYFIQLIIGLWFALGSKGISAFIFKLRYSNR